MEAWENFKNNVLSNSLVRPGDRVVAAVSGGPDSMALLHMLWRLRKLVRFDLMAFTVDHSLRRESGLEVEKVKKFCAGRGIRFESVKIAVRAGAKQKKVSIETSARQMRYSEFEKIAFKNGYNKIATGHSANDNAETVLMWMARGTGPEGLSGIPLQRSLTDRLSVIRPILPVTRPEIMFYVRKNKLPYSVDLSNFSGKYTRNRIRSELVPLFLKFNAGFVEHICNLAKIYSKENEFMDSLARKAGCRVLYAMKDGFKLDLKRYFRYNETIQFRLLKSVLPERKTLANILNIHGWFKTKEPVNFVLSKNWSITHKSNFAVFKKTRIR